MYLAFASCAYPFSRMLLMIAFHKSVFFVIFQFPEWRGHKWHGKSSLAVTETYFTCKRGLHTFNSSNYQQTDFCCKIFTRGDF